MKRYIKFVCCIVIVYAFHNSLISPVYIAFIDSLLITYGIWKLTED